MPSRGSRSVRSRSTSASSRPPTTSCGGPWTPGRCADRSRLTVPPRRLRLDAELVRRGLARSREHASELIAQGRVKVSGAIASKPATGVTTDVAIVVTEDPDRPDYVSRGGHKLAGALAAFEPDGFVVAGRRCLDAGASTGGFTDVLLRHGAAEVVAVDVGYGQLAWRLQQDERVVVHDRTNVRELTPELIGGPVDVVVGDLSFISLALVLDALLGVSAPDARPGADGQAAVRGRQGTARQGRRGPRPGAAGRDRPRASPRRPPAGWGARSVATSPLPGPSGQRRVLPVAARGSGDRRRRRHPQRRARAADPPGVPGEKVDP